MIEDLLRFAHVIGAFVLLGTGSGIAFFMLWAHRSGNARNIAHVAGTVVVADKIFTATAAIAQPVTGYFLARAVGWPLTEPWLMVSIGLYLFIGALWLPVLVIQVRMRDLAHIAASNGTPLPERYHRLFRTWFALGVPAFVAMLIIIWLMLMRPALW